MAGLVASLIRSMVGFTLVEESGGDASFFAIKPVPEALSRSPLPSELPVYPRNRALVLGDPERAAAAGSRGCALCAAQLGTKRGVDLIGNGNGQPGAQAAYGIEQPRH